jgi:ABC-type multidrug transport system fused ATPase/permease subunit
METSIGAIARVKTFAMHTPNENLDSENQPVPENWPSRGAVEFKSLSASYTSYGKPVIRDIIMSIKPGEKIGICGRSGSGKSSLIMTLLRLLELSTDSSIIVDNVNIARVPRQVVRSRFNAIPQDPFFMKGTIRFNASPENIRSDTEIIAALGKVQLYCVGSPGESDSAFVDGKH